MKTFRALVEGVTVRSARGAERDGLAAFDFALERAGNDLPSRGPSESGS
jgi:hypothetical protein